MAWAKIDSAHLTPNPGVILVYMSHAAVLKFMSYLQMMQCYPDLLHQCVGISYSLSFIFTRTISKHLSKEGSLLIRCQSANLNNVSAPGIGKGQVKWHTGSRAFLDVKSAKEQKS